MLDFKINEQVRLIGGKGPSMVFVQIINKSLPIGLLGECIYFNEVSGLFVTKEFPVSMLQLAVPRSMSNLDEAVEAQERVNNGDTILDDTGG